MKKDKTYLSVEIGYADGREEFYKFTKEQFEQFKGCIMDKCWFHYSGFEVEEWFNTAHIAYVRAQTMCEEG